MSFELGVSFFSTPKSPFLPAAFEPLGGAGGQWKAEARSLSSELLARWDMLDDTSSGRGEVLSVKPVSFRFSDENLKFSGDHNFWITAIASIY